MPRKKPDWTPVDPENAHETTSPDVPESPEAVERWLVDGGRSTDADLPFRGKHALADALGHTEWRPAEASPPNREAPAFPGAGFLDALFLDFPFPAGKREVVGHLAEDAALHGGPSATFHDLVIRLDHRVFEDIHQLKRALGEQLAWASAPSEGGPHD
jgi:hypothetical protein